MPQRVDAERLDEIERVEHVADRLRHLLARVEQEAVREDPARGRDPGAHQERRPVDRVEAHDVLADHVEIGRPVFRHPLGVVGVADGREVVGQRIDPDVHHVVRVVRHRDAPFQRGARNGEVLEAALHERDHLVAAGRRADEVRLVLVEREETVLEGAEAEEVARLLHPRDRGAGRRALLAVHLGELALGEERLVAHRVPAAVLAEIDVAGVRHRLPDRLARLDVARLAGGDEVVLAGVQDVRHLAEQGRVAVGEFGRRDALSLRRLDHLLAVLVGAGAEVDVVAVEPLEAGDGVGRDQLVGVPDVGRTVGIGDGGGNGEALHAASVAPGPSLVKAAWRARRLPPFVRSAPA